MSRIHNKNAKLLIYGPEKETVTGLVIRPEPIEVDTCALDIEFSASDVTYASLAGLKAAHGEFTGYYDK